MTPHALLVLLALMAEPGREMYGLEIMRAASLPSGTVYPLLARLEAAGWVSARAEGITPQDEGRPTRRYYRATPDGATAVREAAERDAAMLAALGVPQAQVSTSRIEIPVITDDRQPPGMVSVVSAGLDRDGEPVVSAAHMDIGADEPELASDPGNCGHPRMHVKGTCPDCLTYVARKP